MELELIIIHIHKIFQNLQDHHYLDQEILFFLFEIF